MNLTERVLIEVQKHGNEKQIWFKDRIIGHVELIAKVQALAQGFESSDLKPDNRVLLILKDTPAFTYSFLALIAMGAIPVPINPKIEPETLTYILKDSRASAVIIEPSEFQRLKGEISQSTYIHSNNIILQDLFLDENETRLVGNLLSYFLELKSYSIEHYKYYQKKACSVGFWQYTSGTTGMPKAVQHAQEAMLYSSKAFAGEALRIGSAERLYSIPKMFFGYGLGNSLFFPLMNGASVLLDDAWPTIERVFENIERFKPTCFWGVPKMYSLILKNHPKFNITYLREIQTYFSAGSHMPKGLNEKWSSLFGSPILDGIGSTEIGHVYISNTRAQNNAGVTGWPVAGYEFKILGENGIEVADNQIGVLCIKPPYALLGYWENIENNTKKYKQGWYNSGDLFTKNHDQSYVYQGRNDDLFKVNSRWVNPSDIERLVMSTFKVDECAFIDLIDEQGLELPALFLVSEFEQEEEIMNFLTYNIEAYKRPKIILYINELPKNENGKVKRSVLKAKHLNWQELNNPISI